jgi:hypothetical protein
MPLKAVAIFALFNMAQIKATFAIYNASKISNLPNIMICAEFNYFSHERPFVYNIIVLNEYKIYGERLSEKTSFIRGCDSLNSIRQDGEGDPKSFPRLATGHKSNRMVLNEGVARLGVSLRQTEDQLTRDMLAGSAAFINCVGGTNGDNPTNITRSDINDVVTTLLNNNAYTIMDNIEGEDKFGTAPVRDAYFALCSTQLTADLDSVNGFLQKNEYPAPMNALRSEWGCVGNLRFLVSSIGSVTPNASLLGADVYNIFCVGMEAYAGIEQDGASASFIYRPPIYDGPLALNASIGYKIAECPRILNDEWIINLRATRA